MDCAVLITKEHITAECTLTEMAATNLTAVSKYEIYQTFAIAYTSGLNYQRETSRTGIMDQAVAPGRSQWPRGLRRRSAAKHLLGSWIRIPLGAWMFVLYSVRVVR
jgi:hypothetical protein